MNAKKFSEAMGEIGSGYIEEAIGYESRLQKPAWVKWGLVAACLCVLVAGGAVAAQNSSPAAPNPGIVQVANPVMTVATAEEMEEYLDFSVPVLDKEAAAYCVLVEDGYPTMGQINYADGSSFRVQYGSGDISGIYGGILEQSEEVDGTTVAYYRYQETTYAIWEKSGFAFSYVYSGNGEAEVETLIRQFG